MLRPISDDRGPIWVCDSALEPPRPPYEHMMDTRAPAARENVFRLLHKVTSKRLFLHLDH